MSYSEIDGFRAALMADGPLDDDYERYRLFGRFVGSRDLLVTHFSDGAVSDEAPGEWHFGWVLGGGAVADVWMYPTGRSGPVHEHGMSVRFPDDSVAGWQSTWIGPRRGFVMPFVAREIGDEIVLTGSFAANVETQWIFSNITAESFSWRNQTRTRLDARWSIGQTFAATRSS